jgi:predicted DNA binding CopG/RHH family protein
MDQDLKDLNKRLDKLTTFIEQNMLTKQELEDLRSDLPNREDFANLQSSVDGFAKGFLTTEQELRITSARTLHMEDWVRKAAKKIGVIYKP